MITRLLLRYASVSASLMLVGMFLGNRALLASGVLVLIYIYMGLSVDQPSGVHMEALHTDGEVMVGEPYEFRYRLRVEEGMGLITVGVKVPDQFKVVEGSSFHSIWKREEVIDEDIAFTVRCEKRGEYRLEGVDWETRHPHGFRSSILGETGDGTVLIVRPRHQNVKRVRDRKMFSRIPIPTEAYIQLGVPTTTFKEIREYRVGDPFKSINWKATARSVYMSGRPPMVNEYEKEGRKTVWIFLNTANRMHTGTTVHNCFEYAVQSVLELTDFYINIDSRVGVAFYCDDEDPRNRMLKQNKDFTEKMRRSSILQPDTGREQLNKVKEMMLRVNLSIFNPSLASQVENIRAYTQGVNPLFILVTVVEEDKLASTLEGITEMWKLTRRGRTRPPVLIVHIAGYELVGVDRAAARLRSLEDRATLNRLTGSADLVQWNPVLQGLNEAIIGQVNR